MIKFSLKNIKNNRGYTLLFSVLVSSLVLAIGISILNISKKEFLLATSARDSAAAFYAADGGLEYMLYQIDLGFYPENYPDPGDPEIFIQRRLGSPGTSCARITIKRDYDADGFVVTTIDSRGYNTGWDVNNETCSLTSAKRVERAIVFKF